MESKIEPEVDIMTQSLYGDLNVNNKEDVGPFSSKRVVHESDTPHTKPQQGINFFSVKINIFCIEYTLNFCIF